MLHHALRRTAEAHGDSTAVVDGERRLAYADLDDLSDRLGAVLRSAGIQRGDRVALCMEKSLEAVVGIYAILKAGAAYVPIDPGAPAARSRLVMRDCGAVALIASATKIVEFSGVLVPETALSTVVVLGGGLPDELEIPQNLIAYGLDDVARHPIDDLDVGRSEQEPDDLAYILYTSGSTGSPKGVMLTHRNCLAFVDWAVREFGVQADDVLASHAPLHFDLSVFDLFAAVVTGAAVVLVPRRCTVFPAELKAFLQRHQVTIVYMVPSALTLLMRRGGLSADALPRIRTVLFAGEVFPTRHLRRLMQLLPAARFANLFGPTETNVCTWYDVPPLSEDQTDPIPIGRPIEGVTAHVVENGEPMPAGEVGELFISGPTVMRGYWGDEARTRRALVPSPSGDPAEVAYRTGDLVRLTPDGDLQFLGRRDHQVKSRGFRIELGDVESAIYAEARVTACAVFAVPDPDITSRLVAYVAAGGDVDAESLVDICARHLPAYMIPSSFIIRDDLPRTSTGKIDRQVLAAEISAVGISTRSPG